MIRILMLMMTLVFACSATVEAGWLGDKLKKAAENVGDRMIDDAIKKIRKVEIPGDTTLKKVLNMRNRLRYRKNIHRDTTVGKWTNLHGEEVVLV
jgi:hypothetical protein